MISKTMQKAISEQIGYEWESGFLYLSMASQCEDMGLKGFAHWFYVQFQEEHVHGMGFYKYLVDQNCHVELPALSKPKYQWKTVLEMFQDSLAHEEKVTKLINNLVDLAITERDHATKIRLDWYVTEQVEEEANFREAIDQIKMLDTSKNGLYIMDKGMAARALDLALVVPAVLPSVD